jgi:RNA-binding protein YlmH
LDKQDFLKKFTRNNEDKLLLAKALDKLEETARHNVPSSTKLLNEQERAFLEAALKSLGTFGADRRIFWGGYENALRTVLIFLPDYMEPKDIITDYNKAFDPLAYIRVEYPTQKTLNHRDFLGSLLSSGVTRETIGDILVGENSCDIVILKEILPYVMSNFDTVGRVKIKKAAIDSKGLIIPELKYVAIKATLASMRLDKVISTGFSLSRTKAGDYIAAGRVMLNYIECKKPDKLISASDIITVRGLGKIELQQVGPLTRKGRLSVIIKKYV